MVKRWGGMKRDYDVMQILTAPLINLVYAFYGRRRSNMRGLLFVPNFVPVYSGAYASILCVSTMVPRPRQVSQFPTTFAILPVRSSLKICIELRAPELARLRRSFTTIFHMSCSWFDTFKMGISK